MCVCVCVCLCLCLCVCPPVAVSVHVLQQLLFEQLQVARGLGGVDAEAGGVLVLLRRVLPGVSPTAAHNGAFARRGDDLDL